MSPEQQSQIVKQGVESLEYLLDVSKKHDIHVKYLMSEEAYDLLMEFSERCRNFYLDRLSECGFENVRWPQ